MAYKFKATGMDEVEKMLGRMAERAQGVAAGALYEGAGIMAGEIEKGAASIKTAPFKYASTARGETRMPSPEEKEIVQEAAAGIAKFQKNGMDVDTSVGYRNSGYAELKGKTVPIPKVINSINSGTSFMKKQPFFRKAVSTASPKATAKMKAYIENAYEDMNK